MEHGNNFFCHGGGPWPNLKQVGRNWGGTCSLIFGDNCPFQWNLLQKTDTIEWLPRVILLHWSTTRFERRFQFIRLTAVPRFLTTLVSLVEPNGTFSSSLVSFLRPVASQLSSLHLQVCSLFEMKLDFFLFFLSLKITLAGLTPNYRCRVPGCESANASYYDNQVNHHIVWCQFHQEWRWFGQVVTNKEVRSFTPYFTETPLKDFLSWKDPNNLPDWYKGPLALEHRCQVPKVSS